jgi:hypothetical protein
LTGALADQSNGKATHFKHLFPFIHVNPPLCLSSINAAMGWDHLDDSFPLPLSNVSRANSMDRAIPGGDLTRVVKWVTTK